MASLGNLTLMSLSRNVTNGSASFPPGVTSQSFNTWFSVNLFFVFAFAFLYFNIFVVLIRQGQYKKASGVLILHQVTTEAFIAIFHYLTMVIRTFGWVHHTYFPSDFCRHYQTTYIVTVGAGVWGILALALNRFIAILYPHMYKQWTKAWVIFGMVAFGWIVSFFSMLAFYLGYAGGITLQRFFYMCSLGGGGGTWNFAVALTFHTYLPLCGAALLYVIIFVSAEKQKWHAANAAHGDSAAAEAAQKAIDKMKPRLKLAQVLFMSALLFCVCFASVPVAMSVSPDEFRRNYNMQMWFRTILFIGYSVTPITFLMLNREYRQEAIRFWQTMLKIEASTVHPKQGISSATKTDHDVLQK